MNNNKIRSFLLSGIFLTFIGLKDIEHFNVFYEGIALALGITALVLAGIEYKKKIDQEEKDNTCVNSFWKRESRASRSII